MKTSELIKKSHSKRGAPGALKRKVSGKMTIAKAKALKSKPGATTMDKKQANFFINMARARNEQLQQERLGLWDRIRAKRASGKKMNPKGHPDAPTSKEIKKAQGKNEMTTTADAGIPHDTKNMGPKLKTTYMHDRRRKKNELPVMLKRFSKYMADNGVT